MVEKIFQQKCGKAKVAGFGAVNLKALSYS